MLDRRPRRGLFTLVLLALLTVAASGCAGTYGAVPVTPAQHDADAALTGALETLGTRPGDADLLLITNAGYGQAAGVGSEPFVDIAMRATGCTPGTQSLLTIVTSPNEQLWFALCRPQAGKAVFLRLHDNGFARQTVDISPERILTPEGWTEAAKGEMGNRTFSVVSIALSRAAGATWPMLKAAELHDHFCPGLNAGFIVLEYLKRELPLAPGESYTFVGAPPFCAMDAFQILGGRTLGKRGVLGLLNTPEAGAALARDGVDPALIVLRVNAARDVCDGVVLGFDWSRAYAASGLGKDDLNPPGGYANPMFFISRATMSYQLAQVPLEDKLAYLVELRSFTGPASLAKRIAGGGADPYGVLPQ